jgi:SAM-dependent methyltransferase
MADWTRRLFVERSDLFLRFLDARWSQTGELVDGMVRVLESFGVKSGCMLDLCCGNGRVAIHMAKRGFKAVGVDMSNVFLEDAKKKARERRVTRMVKFLEGDVRRLKDVVGSVSEPFDVVVNAWTSVGYSSQENDLSIFKQARELSRKDAILFIAQTTHSEYISLKFVPTSYTEVDDMVLMESRKYDATTSQMMASWAFYNKRGEDLKFVDRIEYEIHVYSLSELSSLLRDAGWEVVASYGNLSTLQPMSPLTSLNIIAKAR